MCINIFFPSLSFSPPSLFLFFFAPTLFPFLFPSPIPPYLFLVLSSSPLSLSLFLSPSLSHPLCPPLSLPPLSPSTPLFPSVRTAWDRLFKSKPETQDWFPLFQGKTEEQLREDVAFESHAGLLMGVFDESVELLGDVDAAIKLLTNTGKRHAKLGVDAEVIWVSGMRRGSGDQNSPRIGTSTPQTKSSHAHDRGLNAPGSDLDVQDRDLNAQDRDFDASDRGLNA